MGTNAWGKVDIGTWMHDKRLREKPTKYNIQYLREYKDILHSFQEICITLYFLKNEMKIPYAGNLFWSAKKQKDFLIDTVLMLKSREVNEKYAEVFERSKSNFDRRLEHIWLIIKEDVRLTECYPYFQEKGFDCLKEFDFHSGSDDLNAISEDYRVWAEKHADLIENHMASVKEEIDRKNKHFAEQRAKAKAEKEYLKEIERYEKAKQKLIDSDIARNQKRYKAIERSYEKYYK